MVEFRNHSMVRVWRKALTALHEELNISPGTSLQRHSLAQCDQPFRARVLNISPVDISEQQQVPMLT